MTSNILFRSIVLMKVGSHSGFSLEEIIAMKRQEEEKYGKFFWGYAGTLCHPFRVVDFAAQVLSNNDVLRMVMTFTSSKYFASTKKLGEFSKDGIHWEPLPDGVILTGCKYALVGKNLYTCQANIDLNSYVVWDGGPQQQWGNQGRILGDYLRGRVNKACAVISPPAKRVPYDAKAIYVTDIVEPYCVFVK